MNSIRYTKMLSVYLQECGRSSRPGSISTTAHPRCGENADDRFVPASHTCNRPATRISHVYEHLSVYVCDLDHEGLEPWMDDTIEDLPNAPEIRDGMRLLRRIFKKLTTILLIAQGPSEDAWIRVGDMRCSSCGQPYLDHVADPFEPWLTVICGGQRVKL